MGYTAYNVEASTARYSSRSSIDHSTLEKENFTNYTLDPEMDIKDKIRKCKDLDDQDPYISYYCFT